LSTGAGWWRWGWDHALAERKYRFTHGYSINDGVGAPNSVAVEIHKCGLRTVQDGVPDGVNGRNLRIVFGRHHSGLLHQPGKIGARTT